MIRCTIELFPHGDMTKKENLGSIDIINDTTGDIYTGNYIFHLYNPSHFEGGERIKHLNGTINGFKRLESDVFKLLFEALKECGYES